MSDEPTVRVWVRDVWQLASGRSITRTVKREVISDPDDAEHRSIVAHQFLEELHATGYDFPEGHARLTEILGMLTD